MGLYMDYKKSQQDLGELPFIFAFSLEQMCEALQERGFKAKLDEHGKLATGLPKGEKLVSLGSGAYCLKSDYELIVRTMHERSQGLIAKMADPDFAYDAFLYEMGNTEYQFNHYQGDYDVVSTFYKIEWGGEDKTAIAYLKEAGASRETQLAFQRAARDFFKMCDENGWW